MWIDWQDHVYLKSIEGMRLLIWGTARKIIWYGIPAYHVDSLVLLQVKKVVKLPNNLVVVWMRHELHYMITF